MSEFTQSELEAYLDEALAPEEMAIVENAIRNDKELLRQLSAINGRRDAGLHTLGEIWRRYHVSCPPREQLGSFLLNVLSKEQATYVDFHVSQIGCRYCRANLEDLERQQAEASQDTATRRKRYFQSSAGLLRRDE